MPPNGSKLRSPNDLELLFYKDLLAPLNTYLESLPTDQSRIEELKRIKQRFRKEIWRYGYVITERGVMVHVDADILEIKMSPHQRSMVLLDMKILDRLTDSR